jgi:hypothetical protein
MPKQASKRPWRLYQNYALDIVTLRLGKVDDGSIREGKVGRYRTDRVGSRTIIQENLRPFQVECIETLSETIVDRFHQFESVGPTALFSP